MVSNICRNCKWSKNDVLWQNYLFSRFQKISHNIFDHSVRYCWLHALKKPYFLDAPSHLHMRSCPSVRLSILSICPSVPCFFFRRCKVRKLGASCAVYPALLLALPLTILFQWPLWVHLQQEMFLHRWIQNLKSNYLNAIITSPYTSVASMNGITLLYTLTRILE